MPQARRFLEEKMFTDQHHDPGFPFPNAEYIFGTLLNSYENDPEHIKNYQSFGVNT